MIDVFVEGEWRGVGGDGGEDGVEGDGEFGIGVCEGGTVGKGFNGKVELLGDFADGGLRGRFAGFDFATGEFPAVGGGGEFGCAAFYAEHFPSVIDDTSCCNL